LGFAVWWLRGPRPVEMLRAEPLTSLPGEAIEPAFSPDGGKVAFAWIHGAPQRGIYVVDIGSGKVRMLETGGASEDFVYGPAWSPDGKTVAYLRRIMREAATQTDPGNETWLCLVGADGGPEVRRIRLADGTIFWANSTHLSWSPDGTRILAPMADGARRGVHWIPVAGGEPRQLTAPPDHDFAPLLSPDGRAMVYMRRQVPGDAKAETLYFQGLDSFGERKGEARVLFKKPGMTSGLGWLQPGKELAVCTGGGNMDAMGSRMYRMSTEAGAEMRPMRLGRCGSLAVHHTPGRETAAMAFGSVGRSGGQLWRVPLDELGEARPFAHSSRLDQFPSYSPDGSMVAFLSNRSGEAEVWIAGRDGAGARKLTEGSNALSTPQWKPDGSSLLFGAVTPEQEHRVRIVPVTGGKAVEVPLSSTEAVNPSWGPGGEDVYFWAKGELWRVGRDGSGLRKVRERPSRDGYVWGSPGRDGKGCVAEGLFYVFAGESNVLARTDAATGAEVTLARQLRYPCVATSRKYVYFVEGADEDLYALPLTGGERRRIGRLPAKLVTRFSGGMAVSPDDSEMIWGVWNPQQLDLMLVREVR
jgi:Tol biopolymer transport system component